MVAVLRFFEDGVMPEGINDTVIVLIPKGKNPQSLRDFSAYKSMQRNIQGDI